MPSTRLFAVQADGRAVIVEMKKKPWNTLKKAVATGPQWVATITGTLGEAVDGGFRLEDPRVQVFEKKPKANAAAEAAPAPEPAAPAAPMPERTVTSVTATAPVMGYPQLTLKGRVTPKAGI